MYIDLVPLFLETNMYWSPFSSMYNKTANGESDINHFCNHDKVLFKHTSLDCQKTLYV